MAIYFNDIHRWNSMFCPPIGFLLNFIFIWLIFSKTPKEMQKHSRILLQTCVLDILLLAIQTIGQPIITLNPTMNVTFFDGYILRILGNENISRNFLILFYRIITICSSCLSGIAVQFFYRYLLLNKDYQLTMCQYLLLLMLFPCIGSLNLFVPLQFDPSLSLENFHGLVDFDAKPVYLAFTVSFTMLDIFIFFLTTLSFVASNVIVIICGWKMVRFMNAHSGLSERLKELNKQLTKTLIILAICPFLFQWLICFFPLAGMFTNLSPKPVLVMQLYPALLINWLPAFLNPMVSIYVNRPYRDAMLRKFNIIPTAPQ